MVSMERGTAILDVEKIKADGTGFGSFGPDAMTARLLGILRHLGF
jgi:hypothetical protein